MKISVIIPSFNRAHTLGRALDSVLAQTHKADEIIVVDDASTDATAQLLDGYPGIERIVLSQNKGVSAARNVGINAAQNQWLALLDSDDEWLPQKLAAQVAMVADSPETVLVHTDEKWIRNAKHVNQKHKHAKPAGWVYEASLALCCVSPSSVLIHRSVLDTCGVFDECLPACEDYDLWLRIFSRFPISLVNSPLVIKYGGHADQLSEKYWGMDRFRIKALCKILDSGVLSAGNRRKTLTMLKAKCEIVAQGAAKRQKFSDAEYYRLIATNYSAMQETQCSV